MTTPNDEPAADCDWHYAPEQDREAGWREESPFASCLTTVVVFLFFSLVNIFGFLCLLEWRSNVRDVR